MRQETLLKIICKIYLVCLKLLGLWPFSYDSASKSFSLTLYAVIPFVMVPFYTITGVRNFSFLLDEVKIVFRNIVLRMVSNAYLVSNLIFSIYIYGTQFRQYVKIKKLFYKIRKLIRSSDRWLPMDKVSYYPQMVKFTLRSFFFAIVYESYHLFSVSYIAHNKFEMYTKVAFILPNFIVKFYPDIFYGGMLMAHFYFHQMNSELWLILNAVIESKSSPSENVIRNLSDKLEDVTVHYFRLIESVKEFNSLTSFRVVLWIFILLMNLVVHLFMQYVVVGTSMQYEQKINMAIAIAGLIYLLMQLFEFWQTASICSRLTNEISATEIMLSSMYLRLDDHVHFKEKVFIYMNRIKHENLEITGSKLFVIDSNLTFSIISSTFSYLVILIQFELSNVNM